MSHLSQVEAEALLVADNETARMALVDYGKLRAMVEMAKAAGQEVPGVTEARLAEIVEEAKAAEAQPGRDVEPQIDRAAELQKVWNTAVGQVWELGAHRLAVGDCMDRAVVEAVMRGERANLYFSDPPYGVERDEGFEGFGGFGTPIARRQYRDDWDSERPTKDTFNLHLTQATSAIIFGGNFFADILPQSTHWIVWDKLSTMPTFGDCELAWTNLNRKSVKKITFQYNGLIGKEKERFHPTQKPVGLYIEILQEYSKEGQTIADFYSGSGTTLIACQNLSRKCRAIELDIGYAAVTIQRWVDLTNQEPRLL